MPADFFGYSRTVSPNGTVMSSELATLSMGGIMSLVQQATGTYAQTVNAKFEAGSANLYWVTGQPQGTIQFARLVGTEGFLGGSNWSQIQGQCGSLVGLTLGSQGTSGCTTVQPINGATLSFTNGVPEQITVSFQAGLLDVTEGASIRVATMNRS